jgi:plastocyanin
MSRRPAGLLALSALALAALPALAPAAGEEHPAGGGGAPAGARSVEIDDATMRPSDLVVSPGTGVTWVNTGRFRHTATSDTGLWDSPALASGQTFSITAPQEPGAYAYHCRFHSYIRGTITVSAIDLSQPEPVRFGGRARLRGTVPDVPAGTPVRVEMRLPGAWQAIAEVRTDAEGRFAATSPALRGRTAFRAVVGTDLSPSRRAGVRALVRARLRGGLLTVRVTPARARRDMALERLDLDTYRWHAVHHARPVRPGVFRLREPGVYRVAVPGGRGLENTTSGAVEFRPSQFHIG